MQEQPRLFHYKMTISDSDSECSYVSNLTNFNVMRITIRALRAMYAIM